VGWSTRSGGFEHGGWTLEYDEQMDVLGEGGEIVGQWESRTEALLLGRRTYEIFAGSWGMWEENAWRPDLAGPRVGGVRAPTLLIVGGADQAVLQLNRLAQAHCAVRASWRSCRAPRTCSKSRARWRRRRPWRATGSPATSCRPTPARPLEGSDESDLQSGDRVEGWPRQGHLSSGHVHPAFGWTRVCRALRFQRVSEKRPGLLPLRSGQSRAAPTPGMPWR
jgi:hypothetical protein